MSLDNPTSSLSTEALLVMSDCDRGLADEIDACLAAVEAVQAATAVTALTDNTAGATANSTLEAIASPADSPASADALRDDLVANTLPSIRNNFADLAAKINAIRTALVNAGILS